MAILIRFTSKVTNSHTITFDKAGNNADGQKLDIIESLDSFDQIKIQGVTTNQLSFDRVFDLATPSGQVSGIGIYADGYIEAIYTGSNLSESQLDRMTEGIPFDDISKLAPRQQWWGFFLLPQMGTSFLKRSPIE